MLHDKRDVEKKMEQQQMAICNVSLLNNKLYQKTLKKEI